MVSQSCAENRQDILDDKDWTDVLDGNGGVATVDMKVPSRKHGATGKNLKWVLRSVIKTLEEQIRRTRRTGMMWRTTKGGKEQGEGKRKEIACYDCARNFGSVPDEVME